LGKFENKKVNSKMWNIYQKITAAKGVSHEGCAGVRVKCGITPFHFTMKYGQLIYHSAE
jgi:hypothetical protein